MEVLCRVPRESDLEAVLAIHADPSTNRHNPAGRLRGRAAAEHLLKSWLDDWHSSGIGYWAIERAHDGGVVGFVGVRMLPVHDPWGRIVLADRPLGQTVLAALPPGRPGSLDG